MSSTAHSRGQNTVVDQVLWGQTMDAYEDRHGHLKVDSMSNRKPMKVAQYWCYVVVLAGVSHNTSCRVLDGLELLHQAVTDTVQQAVAVILIIMRPSSLGGGRILRRTLSVRLSVGLSVRPRPVIVDIATSVTCFRQPCGRAVSFVLFTCQGRISYGDLSRTSLLKLTIR